MLPRDRDRDETYPWMGVLAIVIIIGGMLLLFWLAAISFGDDAPVDSARFLVGI